MTVDQTAVSQPWRRLTTVERRAWAAAILDGIEVDRKRQAILISGPCQTCGHDFSVLLTEKEILADASSIVRGIIIRPDSVVDWADTIHFLAACHCQEAHDGRPSLISHGCGASGWLIDDPTD